MDSRHWERFIPREGDIVVATAPKCGTTWTQRIMSLLVFQSPEPRPLGVSPWIDARFMMPLDAMIPMLEAQSHRRFVKTHLSFDAVPVYGQLRYVHVARDGRDACMSWHNHYNGFTPAALERFDAVGAGDETIRAPLPRPRSDRREFFLDWMEVENGVPNASDFFHLENSYWSERGRENLLLVHYNDLKADLDGEMRRIAAFLGIGVNEHIWPSLVDAARFETMKAQGRDLLPNMASGFEHGTDTFLFRGTNGRWRDVLSDEDVALYEKRAAAAMPPGLRAWLVSGGLVAGDPKTSGD
jgi:aryl sulfotransferase